ncbi:MAG TPA: peptide-N4-asparagine amidase [Dyella sp.]|uniref:peptide-N4-asparagine amidase n=1 Tax=Dyella sp. TaxID=1869338 RepID=UPI002F93FFD3
MSHRALARRVLYVASLCALGFAGTAFAGGVSQPTVGSTNVAVADPGVPRPAGTPCVVELFSNESFTDATNHPFNYAPPAGCQGNWAKVVLEADFSVTGQANANAAAIWVGGVNLFFGTTQQTATVQSPSWHVERDLTDYTAVLKSVQQGQSQISTLITGNNIGTVTGTARLLFYPGTPAASTPDAVYPLGSDPVGATVKLVSPSDAVTKTITLPRNVEKAYLDVFAQGRDFDAQWYTCVPDEYLDRVVACGGGSFREAEVSIDGQPAGVAPVYPSIAADGFDANLWQPTPGVQTLNFMPYRVDLTPFAGVLSNGQPHTVSVNVAGADNAFAATAALLVYRDANSQQVTGSVTRNTLVGQSNTPAVSDTLQTDATGNINGAINTALSRQFVIEGVANTSKGRVTSTVKQTVGFTNSQAFTSSDTQLRQVSTQSTTVDSNSQSKIGSLISADYRETYSYPLSVDFNQTIDDSGNFEVASTVQQGYQKHLAHRLFGVNLFTADVSNTVNSTNTQVFDANSSAVTNQDQHSSQDFSYTDSLLGCYKASLTSADGAVASFKTGKGCLVGQNRVSWFTHPDGSPDGGNASLLW